MKLLFLTNGYGEDTIAKYIIDNLYELGFKDVVVFPLVTKGDVFDNVGIVGPVKVFPSSGISGFLNLFNFIKDIKAGLFGHIKQQIKFLKSLNDDLYFVAVGDVYPVLLLYFSGKIRKSFFVATAKSIKTEPFNFLEISLMKNMIANFVRDEITLNWIVSKYVLENVYFEGNPVLDLPMVEVNDEKFLNVLKYYKNIIILPGRKDIAVENLKNLIPFLTLLVQKGFCFTIVVPHFYPLEEIVGLVKEFENVFIFDSKYYRFLLESSFLVWGFGGSANEQAAGFGLPVISLYSKLWYRQRQKKLLKDSLVLVDNWEGFYTQTMSLVNDVNRYVYLSNIGRREMGKFGGAMNIAKFIQNFLSIKEK